LLSALHGQVGVRGQDLIVLAVEKKSTAKLQDARTVRKTAMLDDRLCLAFAGLTADARVLINKARRECQSYRLMVDDAPSVDYIARHIATLQQRYTQSGGVRPFGISTLIIGFDNDGTPRLFQTDPSGMFSEWQANAIGRNAKTVLEFLEKKYPESVTNATEDKADEATIRLAVKAILEVVESSHKNIEVTVMKRKEGLKILEESEVEALVSAIEAEKAEADAAKKTGERPKE
jgi:20S proteasome subunit alpha 4